jgi:hypothetical protein
VLANQSRIVSTHFIISGFIFVEVVFDSLRFNIDTGPFVTAWQENKGTWSQGQEMNSAKNALKTAWKSVAYCRS